MTKRHVHPFYGDRYWRTKVDQTADAICWLALVMVLIALAALTFPEWFTR